YLTQICLTKYKEKFKLLDTRSNDLKNYGINYPQISSDFQRQAAFGLVENYLKDFRYSTIADILNNYQLKESEEIAKCGYQLLSMDFESAFKTIDKWGEDWKERKKNNGNQPRLDTNPYRSGKQKSVDDFLAEFLDKFQERGNINLKLKILFLSAKIKYETGEYADFLFGIFRLAELIFIPTYQEFYTILKTKYNITDNNLPSSSSSFTIDLQNDKPRTLARKWKKILKKLEPLKKDESVEKFLLNMQGNLDYWKRKSEIHIREFVCNHNDSAPEKDDVIILVKKYIEPLTDLRNKIAHSLGSANALKIEEYLEKSIEDFSNAQEKLTHTREFFELANNFFQIEEDREHIFSKLNLYIKASLKLPIN
ncbi:MAG: hypothetical protein AAF135_21205, partial [Bacteroidota bacterium]